jgi:hypothetical protein
MSSERAQEKEHLLLHPSPDGGVNRQSTLQAQTDAKLLIIHVLCTYSAANNMAGFRGRPIARIRARRLSSGSDGIARETVEVLQLSEDGQVDLGTESAVELVNVAILVRSRCWCKTSECSNVGRVI